MDPTRFNRTWNDLWSERAKWLQATSWSVCRSNKSENAKVEGVVDLKCFLGHRQVLQLVPFLCTIEFPLQSRFNCWHFVLKSNWHQHDSLLFFCAKVFLWHTDCFGSQVIDWENSGVMWRWVNFTLDGNRNHKVSVWWCTNFYHILDPHWWISPTSIYSAIHSINITFKSV